MPRKPSDDVRDARRLLKIKGQQVNWLDHNSKGETKGWSADPTVKKTKDYKSNKDGFRVDWDEKHHVMGLNLYERYTAGMSPQQIKIVDERLAQKGLIKGNNGLNRIDLPRRLHESSKFPGIEGAHQVTKREGIDSKDELARLKGLSVDEKLGELDSFIDQQVRHRQVGQQKFMEQFQLQPGNNSETNVFGGNFSQAVLQNRDKLATAKAGKALSEERKIVKQQTASASTQTANASTKLNINPKAQTTAPTPKPTVNPKPTGYVHRNRGPSETPPVTTGGNPITEFLGSPQVTKGLQQVVGAGAAALTILGSGLKSLFVGGGV